MNVYYDAQVFSFQEYGGISRYFSEIIQYFLSQQQITPNILVQYSNNRYIKDLPQFNAKPLFANRKFKGKHEILKYLNRRYVKRTFGLDKHPDLFHPTYYDPYFLDIIAKVPFVATVYDMTHELYPQQFHQLDFTVKNKRIVTAKADRIIAISESTKRDIIRLHHIPESRIDVIPLAANITPSIQQAPQTDLPEKYFLYIGKRNTYKNFDFLLRALNQLKSSDQRIILVCAGGGSFSKQEQTLIHELELHRSIIQVEANDPELAYLYTHATALVYPSQYEGFGIPILEAFICGCPVLASDRSSLPEVGGDAAKYFNPDDPSTLVDLLKAAQNDITMVEEMKARGIKRAKLYSWEQTAQSTLDIYKKIVHG
jgi:glycosyltransferase involved in cell wall biosynthesis